MIKGILGKKLGMSRLFLEEGRMMPVTIIQSGPCTLLQKKSREKDGYVAVQLGFVPKKASKVNKPEAGHLKKAELAGGMVYIREVPAEDLEAHTLGEVIGPEIFEIGEKILVTAVSKGKGFAGVVKRWNFRGGKATHGCTAHRVPGSIGASSYPSRVFKGKKLPGHMGDRRVTVRNLKIVDIRPESNLVLLKGAVPGANGGLVLLKKAGA
jgi:large subunit ribosomal protein L3